MFGWLKLPEVFPKVEKEKEKEKVVFFKPKEDITTFELAQCMVVQQKAMYRTMSAIVRLVENLSDDCRRHFLIKERQS